MSTPRLPELAAAIAHDADTDDVPGLEIDVRARTFSDQERGDDGRPERHHVAVLEHMLEVTPGTAKSPPRPGKSSSRTRKAGSASPR